MSTLILKIENQKDVSLVDLTTSLLNIGAQYNRFLETKGVYSEDVKNPLVVKKLVSGSSIVIELVSPIVPAINDVNPIFAFACYFRDSIEYFLGNKKQAPKKYDKKDLEQLNSILSLIADSPSSSLNISARQNE